MKRRRGLQIFCTAFGCIGQALSTAVGARLVLELVLAPRGARQAAREQQCGDNERRPCRLPEHLFRAAPDSK